MTDPILVAVSPELAEQMLEPDGYPIRRDARVRLSPAPDWERALGATYQMIFTEEAADS